MQDFKDEVQKTLDKIDHETEIYDNNGGNIAQFLLARAETLKAWAIYLTRPEEAKWRDK